MLVSLKLVCQYGVAALVDCDYYQIYWWRPNQGISFIQGLIPPEIPANRLWWRIRATHFFSIFIILKWWGMETQPSNHRLLHSLLAQPWQQARWLPWCPGMELSAAFVKRNSNWLLEPTMLCNSPRSQHSLVVPRSISTHCDPVTPYAIGDLVKHSFRQWLVAWRHQAITWTNVDLSSARSGYIHLRTVSQDKPQPSIPKSPI